MKSQIQITVLVFSILFVSLTYAQKNKRGNGNIVTIERTTSDYDGVKCAGFMDFILVKGQEGQILIEGDENLLEYIITEVKNNQLIVKTKNKINLKPTNRNGIKITIPFQDISSASLSGSGDLINKDKIIATNFNVTLSGSGDVVIDLRATSVKGALSGSGDLTIKGSTNNLEAKVSGSGDFHGFNLEANNAEVSIAGSGDVKVVSNKSLKARVAGSGDIVYKGNPIVDSKVSGSGSISNR